MEMGTKSEDMLMLKILLLVKTLYIIKIVIIYNLGNSNEVCSLKLLARKIIKLKKILNQKLDLIKNLSQQIEKDREINYRFCSTKKHTKILILNVK